MRKTLKTLVALLAIAAAAAPVIAAAAAPTSVAERLSYNGTIRIRGFFASVDDSTEKSSHDWNDERLRVGGKFVVDEGISVHFRFDALESNENSSTAVAWGGSTSTYAPYSHRRADIQFDKGYLQIEKYGYTLAAGQQYFGVGYHQLNTVGTGLTLRHGSVSVAHVKQYDSNAGDNSFNKTGYDETSLTAVSYTYKGENFGLTPIVTYSLAESTDVNRLGLGLIGYSTLGAIRLKGEIDYFRGETAAGADEKGLQIYLDGSTAVSETVTLGLIGLYAQGQKGGDVQVTNQAMPVFAGWHPEAYGPFSTDFVSEANTFDPSGSGAGVLGAVLYSDVKVGADLKLQFAATYFMSEDDSIYDFSGSILNAGCKYALTAKTSLSAQISYQDFDDAGTDFSALQSITGLTVMF